MKLAESNTLEGYITHAEHYGTDEVFETAVDQGLPLWDLGRLALRLQNLNPNWKLTVEGQRVFVLALTYWQVVGLKDAARMAGVTLPTARAWYEAGYSSEEDPNGALQRASTARFTDLKGIVRGWHRTA